MSSKLDTIDISSDSTSSDELMSLQPHWNLPHTTTNSIKKMARKRVDDSSSTYSSDSSSISSYVSSYNSSSVDVQSL